MLRKLIVLRSFFLAQAAYAASAAVPEVKTAFVKTSDAVRLYYLDSGSGPTIVFEPGWSIPAWIWESQIPHFAEHYHVVALDSGRRESPTSLWRATRLNAVAQDIHELVEHLKLRRVVLVGWSLGVSELLS